MPIIYYNRRTRQREQERVLGDAMLRLAYKSPIRGLLRWPLFACSLFSRIMGVYCDSRLSRPKIRAAIRSLNIDMTQFQVPEGGFSCFNDFFTRKVLPGKRPFAPEGLCSPADARLTVLPKIDGNTCIPVKGTPFTLSELLGDNELAASFANGSVAVFRLCPTDYHRFHFPDDGVLLRRWRIPGNYHSVNPIAIEQGFKVFTSNVRDLSLLELTHFGKAVCIEVGAFGVASIRRTFSGGEFARGDEKGYFAFGGSTVILVLREGAVAWDADIVEHSAEGIETLVQAGESIAR